MKQIVDKYLYILGCSLISFFVSVNPLGCQPGIAHLLFKRPIKVIGQVLDGKGNPLRDVSIDHVAVLRQGIIQEESAHSNSEGRFEIQTLAPAAVLRKEGFRSVLLKFNPESRDFRVTMLPAPPVVVLPTCIDDVADGVWTLEFPDSQGVRKGTRGRSIDTSEQIFTTKNRSSEMTHGAGASWGGPLPRSQDIWSSVSYEERWRSQGAFRVLDARGKTSHGNVWRSLSIAGESAFYYDLNPNVADVFDVVLDKVCKTR